MDAFAEDFMIPTNDLVPGRLYFLNTPFDFMTMSQSVDIIDRQNADSPFRYVVTPNADHVVRLNKEPGLKQYYESAWLILCDSKPISLFARLRSQSLTHVTGSDLTVALFRTAVRRGDRIALILGAAEVGRDVQARYPEVEFSVHVPPMGLWRNAEAIQECVDFVVRERARFTFIAVGAPQSEKIAYLISRHPKATGVGLCVGASLEFLVGTKRRAPLWMQKLSLEWLHRMVSDPKRLWRRYVFGLLPLVRLFVAEVRGRRYKAPTASIQH